MPSALDYLIYYIEGFGASKGVGSMILIDENKLTYGCIELILNCYGIEVPYVDNE